MNVMTNEERVVYEQAYTEAYDREYQEEYDRLFEENYQELMDSGIEPDEARRCAHSNVIKIATDNASSTAKDIAQDVLSEWRAENKGDKN